MKKLFNYCIPFLIISIGFTIYKTYAFQHKPLGTDPRLFQGTIAWDAALVIHDDNSNKVREIVNKNKQLISFTDPYYGETLLAFAVYNQKYNSVKALIDLGADPNKFNNSNGRTPLMEAIRIGNDYKYHSRYLILLLKHGGNPNLPSKKVDYGPESVSPLIMTCVDGNLEFAKILVEAGADINYHTEGGGTALYSAIISENPDLVYYLLTNGADYKKPFKIVGSPKEYITHALKYWDFDLNSEKYKKKMQIISFLKEHGVDH